MKRRIPPGILAACFPIALAVCQSPEAVPLFPSIPGWALTRDSTVYTNANLWDLIDGSAELFLSCGFLDLHTGQYVNPSGIDVRVELYRHSSPLNAFGIYSQERNTDYAFVDMGTQGYVEDGILNFLSGSYYVKLSSHRHGTEVRDALAEIARRVNEHLRQPVGWPKGLALLPETGRVPNSETFVAQNFLGYRCLDSAYVAEYDTAEHLRMFVIELATPADAHRVTETYLREIQHPRKSIDDGTFIVDDRHNGSVCIVLRGNRLGGIIGYSEKYRGFRRELEEVISDHPR